MKKIKIIYIVILSLLVIGSLIGGYFLGYETGSFYYLLTSILLIAIPFVSLLFILFIEVKRIEFSRSQYLEAYFVVLMIAGSLLEWLYSKLEISLEIVYWHIFSLLAFCVITVIFMFLHKKHKNDPKNGPKFIANK